MTTDNFDESSQLSRRSLLTALFAAAVVAPVAALIPDDAEAQERQFTTFHHQPRSPRPRSHARGSRRHRRVARVRRTGPAKSTAPETSEKPAQ
ncbi:hypothetical protein [Methylocystis sp.]|jgi:hypothetical protein|uniref:hypothetical protein n=1 Tax=Methylocystis sp. TaxID=1911079 RepID=UPI0025D612E2|nr:hypothetical protein [Methylocystis sp.]